MGKLSARRGVIIGFLFLGVGLGGAIAWPGHVAGAGAAPDNVIRTAPGDGRDAPWLRMGLIGILGLALAGGAVVQYRSSDDAPPHRPQPRRPQPRRADIAPPARADTPPGAALPRPSVPLPAPVPTSVVQWRPSAPAPTTLASYRRQRGGVTPPAARDIPSLSPAEAACARAVAAAHRYDRHATVEHFVAALIVDPAVKPSAVPTFWEIPAGGHADLARAYVRQGQRLDARSVVTMALLTFPHDRELALIRHELAPDRRAETA